MRRSGSARRCVVLAGLMLAEMSLARAPVDAAPLDFLFGGPPPAGYRGTRRRRPPQPRQPQPQAPVEAEIPLPVPRPHFPGDPPQPGELAETLAAPAEPAPAPAGPPLPPPKPPEIANPPALETKPATPAPETAKPPEPETAKPPVSETRPAAPGPKPVESPVPVPVAPPATPPVPPTPPPKPPEIAKPGEAPKPGETQKPGEAPKPVPPAVAPSGATTAFTPRSPEDDPACPGRLKAHGVAVEPVSIGPQPDDRCTVVQAVRLSSLAMPDGGKVEFPEKPTIACTTADAFSSFVRDLMVPLAKGTFTSPVAAIWTGPGLECRSRDHVFGAKLSAHGQGLAIDIAKLKLADGRTIEVGDPKTDLEIGFETAARAGACGFFHTVLGPGSDSYHRTHWHFDLEVRGAHGDSKYCK